MKKLLEVIGVFVFTAFLMAIPICCALSFALKWVEELRFLLTVVFVGEFIMIAALIGAEYTD